MNETLQNILARKSYSNFASTPISEDDIDLLLQAAMAAPTGMDMRPWKFIVVTDKTTLQSISEALTYGKMVKTAAAAIVVCGNAKKSLITGASYWVYDCSAATENILIAAQSMGIGGRWVSVAPSEKQITNIKALFKLPEDIEPLCTIALGYPEKLLPPKKKFDRKNIHWEKW